MSLTLIEADPQILAVRKMMGHLKVHENEIKQMHPQHVQKLGYCVERTMTNDPLQLLHALNEAMNHLVMYDPLSTQIRRDHAKVNVRLTWAILREASLRRVRPDDLHRQLDEKLKEDYKHWATTPRTEMLQFPK